MLLELFIIFFIQDELANICENIKDTYTLINKSQRYTKVHKVLSLRCLQQYEQRSPSTVTEHGTESS